jgi:hypothetical protein
MEMLGRKLGHLALIIKARAAPHPCKLAVLRAADSDDVFNQLGGGRSHHPNSTCNAPQMCTTR